MLIGELSKLTGATPKALRLYESLNLLQVKRQGKYQVYQQSHVKFVMLIKEAQSFGVLIAELQELKRDPQDLDWG